MAFTPIHPAGLPSPPPGPVPATSIITAANLTSITHFLFQASACVEDGTTKEGVAWRELLDGLHAEEIVHYVYWGFEERTDGQGKEEKRVILAVDRYMPKPMSSSREFSAAVLFPPLVPYLLKPPQTTHYSFYQFTPHLALGFNGGITFCTFYRVPASIPPEIVAEIPSLWSYELAALMPRGGKAKGTAWGVEGCAGGWLMVDEGEGDEEKVFIKLLNWGSRDQKAVWDASLEGKKFKQLWGERSLGGRETWVARMNVDEQPRG